MRRDAGIGVGIGFRAMRKPAAAAWTPASWGSDRLVDFWAEDVVEDGGKVTTMVDQTATSNAVQANALYQPVLVAADIGGKPAVRFTSDVLNFAATHADTRWTVFYVARDDSPASGKYAFDTQTGRLGCMPTYAIATNTFGVLDGAIVAFNAATGDSTPAVSNALVLDNGSASLYRGGAAVQTGRAYTARQVGGTSGVGAKYTTAPGDPMLDWHLGRFVVLKRAATADDLAKWFAWTLAYYGV